MTAGLRRVHGVVGGALRAAAVPRAQDPAPTAAVIGRLLDPDLRPVAGAGLARQTVRALGR